MSGEVTLDASELRAFSATMTRAIPEVAREVMQATAKGGVNIKTQLRAEARDSEHFRLERHISYDVEDGGFGVVVGPEKVGAGNLANIAYFGGANGGGGTVPDPRGALDAEVPRYVDALSKIAEGFLR